MKTIKSNYILLFCLLFSVGIFAQTKKLEKTYKTKQDVSVVIDAKYTNIIIENWDKNEVAIEAYLEAGNLKGEDAKKALESWKLETSGNSDKIEINSGGGTTGMNLNMDLSSLTESMGDLQNILGPMMTDMIAPMLENISKNPLPPEFHEKMGNMDFDYDAYKKDGDKYMEKWEKKMEKNFGKDFEKSMEAWGKQFEENSEVWEKDFEKKMEAWGEDFEKNFGKDMEKWGESFGKKMETWGENFGKEMEAKQSYKGEGNGTTRVSSQGKRIIKIKIPKNANLDLDVRYGELKLGEKTTNLKANLSHSSLSANIIEGEKTKVNVSYSPININVWNYGILKTNYVENCEIGKAKSIKLISNSSDVTIKEITDTGILSGTFGELSVGKLDTGFKNLDITLENSDLRLSLPSAPLNFNYNGTQSNIEYPKATSIKSTKSYDNEILNGYYKSKDGNGSVNINASFSDVYIK
ncbi:hypothetical protein JM83_0535 [Gillisia sp. Hel_I_86]|uniref:hypothetical protein n=1 Tax=Gillisia sp. Hel_I_86 TaxID=1249981 RepID=UPI001198D7EC|nr:hypothetical protein [Gillisia sp. Hel_I_86]TVZ25609.1 hypothetical protein JM83_0535 [Gillisia sp. Hel_I_86]